MESLKIGCEHTMDENEKISKELNIRAICKNSKIKTPHYPYCVLLAKTMLPDLLYYLTLCHNYKRGETLKRKKNTLFVALTIGTNTHVTC